MEPSDNKLPHIQSLVISCISLSSGKLRYYDFPNNLPSVICVEHINSLLIAIHGGGFWSTSARQIGYILVAIFEVFHPVLHAAGTHEGMNHHRHDKAEQRYFAAELFSFMMSSVRACWRNIVT
jgi:hypothetical protein